MRGTRIVLPDFLTFRTSKLRLTLFIACNTMLVAVSFEYMVISLGYTLGCKCDKVADCQVSTTNGVYDSSIEIAAKLHSALCFFNALLF